MNSRVERAVRPRNEVGTGPVETTRKEGMDLITDVSLRAGCGDLDRLDQRVVATRHE
jgi:hypothetical protein